MNRTKPGTRSFPAAIVASKPAISSAPVIRIRLESLTPEPFQGFLWAVGDQLHAGGPGG
jgi:hypothetical protein